MYEPRSQRGSRTLHPQHLAGWSLSVSGPDPQGASQLSPTKESALAVDFKLSFQQ